MRDRRRIGRRGGLVAGGGGLGGLALVLLLVLGVFSSGGAFDYGSPFDRFPAGDARGDAREAVPGAPDPEVETLDFLRFVTADIQEFWQREFREGGRGYQPTQVNVFRQAVSTGCGQASAAVGPFYCTLDREIYLDLSFFRDLATRFRAPGDFAQAYVVAHEFGHHIQNVTGISAQLQQAASQGADQNDLSIRQELQADCLAGVWGHSTYERGLLERGDLDEGLTAAAAVGDDRIQAETTGRIDPETWTHGSAEQRRTWFLRGFEGGDPNECDAFSGDV